MEGRAKNSVINTFDFPVIFVVSIVNQFSMF